MSAYTDIMKEKGIKAQQQVKAANIQPPKPAGNDKKKVKAKTQKGRKK